MSTILDALQKAEHERQLGTLPGIHSVSLPPSRPVPDKGRLPWLVAVVVLLLLLLALSVWQWSSMTGRGAGPGGSGGQQPGSDSGRSAMAAEADAAGALVADTAATAAATPATAPSSVPPAAAAAEDAPPTPSASRVVEPAQKAPMNGSPARPRADVAAASTTSKKGRDETASSSAGPAKAAPRPASKERSEKTVVADASRPEPRTGERAAAKPRDREPVLTTPEPAPNAALTPLPKASAAPAAVGVPAVPVVPAVTSPVASAVRPGTAGSNGSMSARRSPPGTGANENLPTREQLPARLQEQLPPLAISGYIYSANPADRSALINGKLLREGDSMAGEIRLEQMRPEGVVLEYRGTRFKLTY